MGLNVRGSDSLYWKAFIDTGGLSRDAATVKRIIGGIGTFITGYFVRDIMKAALTQDRALTMLAAAYKQTGIYSGALMRNTGKLANEMMAVANVEDEVIENGIALMTVIGNLSEKQIPDATKAAIGLSKAYGIDLSAAFTLIGRAATGQTQMLARQGIVLKEGGTVQERFNELLAIGAKGFETAKALAGDATGQWDKFKISVGEAKEALGAFATADTVLKGISVLTSVVNWLATQINSTADAWDYLAIKTQEFFVKASYYAKVAGNWLKFGQIDVGAANENARVQMEQEMYLLKQRETSKIFENEYARLHRFDKTGAGGVVVPVDTETAAEIEKRKQLEADYSSWLIQNDKAALAAKIAALNAEIAKVGTRYAFEHGQIEALEKHQQAYDEIVKAEQEDRTEDARKRKEAYDEQVAADAKYHDWKVSASKDTLKAEIERIDFEMSSMNEREAIDKGLTEERKRRIEQLHAFEVDENKAKLDQIIQDTRGWDKKRLLEYAAFLKNQEALYADNDEMRGKIIEKYDETMQKAYDSEIKKIQEIGDTLRALGSLAGQFDSNLGDIIGKAADIFQSIKSMKDATTGWGTFAGGLGILDTYISLMRSLTASTGPTSQEKTIAALERFGRAIEKNTEALRRSIGEDVVTNLIAVYRSLETQREANMQAIRDIKTYDRLGRYTDRTLGDIFTDEQLRNLTLGSDILKADRKLYARLITGIEDAEAKMFDYRKEYQELLTGTTAESIADSITQGLADGLDSATVFANTFEELMQNALIGAFRSRIVSEYISEFYNTFAELSAGGLTPAEMETLRTGVLNITRGASQDWDTLQSLMEEAGISLPGAAGAATPTTPTGLSGAIAGVSQETAGLLAGQINAMMMSTVRIRDAMLDNDVFGGRLTHINDRLIEVRDATRTTKDYTSVIMSTALDNLQANQETARNTRYLQSIDARLARIEKGGTTGRAIGV